MNDILAPTVSFIYQRINSIFTNIMKTIILFKIPINVRVIKIKMFNWFTEVHFINNILAQSIMSNSELIRC